jgi:uncharacterized membrane protein YhaH (DUF805 family)
MAATENLWSIKGRLARKPYWQLVGTILAVKTAATIALALNPSWTILRNTDFLMILLAIAIGKRMRDFGVSASWGWMAVLIISFVLPIASIFIWPPENPTSILDVIPGWVGLIIFVSLVTLIVWVGVKKGDSGPNRFGEAPGFPAASVFE